MDSDKMMIRSFLLTQKEGSTPEELAKDFQTTTGYPLPYIKRGFGSPNERLDGMPDYAKAVP